MLVLATITLHVALAGGQFIVSGWTGGHEVKVASFQSRQLADYFCGQAMQVDVIVI